MSSYRPSSTSQRISAPAFDALVSPHADTNVRLVYGTIELLATVSVNAWVRAEVETGVGTSSYEIVVEEFNALGALQTVRRSFTFAVEGGRRYRFVKGGGLGVAEAVLNYSYVDL